MKVDGMKWFWVKLIEWVSARWIIGPYIWVSLLGSWGFSVVLMIAGRIGSLIGPALICGSLIAEVCFTRLEWRKILRARPKREKPKEWVGSKQGDEKLYFETFEKVEEIHNFYYRALKALRSLDKGLCSDANPANSIGNNDEAWIYDLDVRYAENFLQSWILFNGVAGTIIWGYGDDIYYWGNLMVWIFSQLRGMG